MSLPQAFCAVSIVTEVHRRSNELIVVVVVIIVEAVGRAERSLRHRAGFMGLCCCGPLCFVVTRFGT